MSKQDDHYHNVSVAVATLVILVHGTSAIYGGSIFVGSWLVPMWLNWLAVFGGAYVFYQSFQRR